MSGWMARGGLLWRAPLAALFILAVVLKMEECGGSVACIEAQALEAGGLGVIGIFSVAAAELLVGVALLTKRWWALGALGAMVLTVSFSLYLIYLQLVGGAASCGCLGRVRLGAGSHLLLLAGMLGLAFACVGPGHRPTVKRPNPFGE